MTDSMRKTLHESELEMGGAFFPPSRGSRTLKEIVGSNAGLAERICFSPPDPTKLLPAGAWEADPLGHDPYRGKVTQGTRFIYHVIF
jgi:hypothetical protein